MAIEYKTVVVKCDGKDCKASVERSGESPDTVDSTIPDDWADLHGYVGKSDEPRCLLLCPECIWRPLGVHLGLPRPVESTRFGVIPGGKGDH